MMLSRYMVLFTHSLLLYWPVHRRTKLRGTSGTRALCTMSECLRLCQVMLGALMPFAHHSNPLVLLPTDQLVSQHHPQVLVRTFWGVSQMLKMNPHSVQYHTHPLPLLQIQTPSTYSIATNLSAKVLHLATITCLLHLAPCPWPCRWNFSMVPTAQHSTVLASK